MRYGVTDTTAGLFSAIGILLALRAREMTGRGQYGDVAMLDSMISTMSSNYMSYLGSGEAPKPMGTAFPTVEPYRVFPAADTAVAIAVGSERLWSAFCAAIRPRRFGKASRLFDQWRSYFAIGALEPLLECEFRKRPTSEWVARLQRAGVPASPVRNFKDVVEHPQTAAREMFPTIEHPAAGAHRVTGTPVKLSGTPGSPGAPAPLLGQHTRHVLKELLGLDDSAIDALAESGVICETACQPSSASQLSPSCRLGAASAIALENAPD